jgi:O-antigen/teichoic acid export membrane protein
MNDITQKSIFLDRLKQLFKKGGIYSFGSSLQLIVNFFLIPVYTSFLSIKDYGILSLMTITAALIMSFTTTPTATGFVRYFYVPQFEGRRKIILFNSIIYALSGSLLISLIFLMSGHFLANFILGNEDFANVIYVYSVIIFIQPLFIIGQNLLVMQKRAIKYITMHFLNTIISAGLIIFLMKFFGLTYMALIWGALASTSFPILFFLSDIFKNIQIKIDIDIIKMILKYGYPLVLTALSLFLIEYADQYIIKYFLGVDAVGLYSFGFKFAFIINVLLILPVHNIINPLIYELEKDKENLLLFVKRILTIFVAVSVFIALSVTLYTKEIIIFMAQKPEFWDSWNIIPALTLSYVFYGIIEITGKGINLSNRSTTYGLIFLFSAVLNFSLSIGLIHLIGIQGSPVAKMIAFFMLNVGLMYFSYRYYDFVFEIGKILIIIGSGVICFLVSSLIQFDSILLSLIFKTLLIMLYFALLFIFRILNKDMLNYAKDQIKSINRSAIKSNILDF